MDDDVLAQRSCASVTKVLQRPEAWGPGAGQSGVGALGSVVTGRGHRTTVGAQPARRSFAAVDGVLIIMRIACG